MILLSEPIDVWVFFQKNLIEPYSFIWRRRRIKIDKINLIHTSKNGASLFYHFSVSAGGNFYRLMLDAGKMKWILEAVESD